MDSAIFTRRDNDLAPLNHCAQLRFSGVAPKGTTSARTPGLWTTASLCRDCPQSCALTGGERVDKGGGCAHPYPARRLSSLRISLADQQLASALHSCPQVVHRVRQGLWGEGCDGVVTASGLPPTIFLRGLGFRPQIRRQTCPSVREVPRSRRSAMRPAPEKNQCSAPRGMWCCLSKEEHRRARALHPKPHSLGAL